MVDVSCSDRPISPIRPLKPMEDQEQNDENDNLSSSAGMGNAFSHCSRDPPAAQLGDEFKQFLVERGTYKELKKTISSVLHELLQAKRTDGSPLFVFYMKEGSSTDNSCPKSTLGNTYLSHNRTIASVLPSPKKSVEESAKILKQTRAKSDGYNQRTESKCQGNCDPLKHRGTTDPLTPMDQPKQTSSQGSVRHSGNLPSRQQADPNKILSDILQAALISVKRWTRMEMHLSNQLGMIVKPPIGSTKL